MRESQKIAAASSAPVAMTVRVPMRGNSLTATAEEIPKPTVTGR